MTRHDRASCTTASSRTTDAEAAAQEARRTCSAPRPTPRCSRTSSRTSTRGNLEDAVRQGAAAGRGHVRHRGDLERRSRTRSWPRATAARCSSASATASTSSPATCAAILAHTRQVVYLDDGEMAVLDARRLPRPRLETTSRSTKKIEEIDWDLDAIEKGGYEHFMLKEIFEQPDDASRTRCAAASSRTTGDAKLGGLNLTDEEAAQHQAHHHHGVRHVLARGAHRRVHDRGSARAFRSRSSTRREFRYRNPIVDDRHARASRSAQSGETADTLAAMREAKRKGAQALGIVQRRRLDDRARGRRRHLHPRRPRDRRRLDQGVHEPDRSRWRSSRC